MNTAPAVLRLARDGQYERDADLQTVAEPCDLDGDGVPEHFVGTWSGGNGCCRSLFIVNLASAERPIVEVQGELAGVGCEDVDGDGVNEITLYDWAFGWGLSPSGAPEPPLIILTLRDGVLCPDVVAMRRPPRSSDELDSMVELTESGEIQRESKRLLEFQLIGLIYSGNEKLSWEWFDRTWPGQSIEKAEFRRWFLEQLEQSKWWPMIREGYRAETR